MLGKPMDESEIGIPLKDCPFCGYKAEMFYVGSSNYVIRCSNRACRAEQDVYRGIDEAARRWNTRYLKIDQ